jgi:hypothetical protein
VGGVKCLGMLNRVVHVEHVGFKWLRINIYAIHLKMLIKNVLLEFIYVSYNYTYLENEFI